jgi:hypothetical protein
MNPVPGMPDRSPISVPDGLISCCIIAIRGRTAKTVGARVDCELKPASVRADRTHLQANSRPTKNFAICGLRDGFHYKKPLC